MFYYIKKFVPILTCTILTVKLVKVGKGLVPTQASAAMFKFSNRTSIVGRSIPTLISHRIEGKKNRPSIKDTSIRIKKRRNESGSLTYQHVP